MIYSKEEGDFRRGFGLTLLLSCILLFAFYGKLLLNPNQVYFGKNGDGLQSYFGTIYQAKHDSTYWHLSGMNYPYGENSFFTGNQPLLTAFIKLVSNTIYDISGYSAGIVNLAMLLGIVLCALCVFGIFNHLKVPWYFAVFAAIGITFLSPQIQRMGGHYSLAYPFAIPLFILLLLRFSEKPDFRKSVSIGLLTFVMAGTHLYFFGIFAMILGLYYLIGFIRKERWFKGILASLGHFAIQSVLPFIAVWMLVNLNNPVSDRPSTPWGFLIYKTTWKSVFLPVGRPLGQFFSQIFDFTELEWEGIAFVGFVGTVFTLVLLVIFINRIIKRNWAKAYNLTGHPVLNTLFWTSILGLIYSFGIPFVFNMEFLLDYLGVLKQMRGIGRFAWVFFYVINIIAFYMLYQWARQKSMARQWALFALPLAVLLFDGWYSIRAQETILYNNIDRLNGNDKEYNDLLSSIDPSKYQAIIPIPCFAIGSENVWVNPGDDLIRETLILSIKTGLPTTGSILARSSISQTFKHVQLCQEPYVEPVIFNDFKSEKPFLLISMEHLQSEKDRKILGAAVKLADNGDLSLYEIGFDIFKNLSKGKAKQVNDEMDGMQLFQLNDFLATDSINNIFYNGFEDGSGEKAYHGKGSYKGFWKDYHRFMDDTLSNLKAGEEYSLSFWFWGYQHDLYPRTAMELAFVDTINNKSKGEWASLHQYLALYDGDWVLVEWKFTMPENTHKLQFTIWNHDVKPEMELFVDEFLVRPTSNILYKKLGDTAVIKNNRLYKLQGND